VSENDVIFFKVNDPRGREVICTVECWDGHILAQRPFMSGWEDRVIAAISNPTIGIFQDVDYPNRHVFYRRQNRPRYIKVVVAIMEHEADKVITAFPADSMKPGEKLIWPQSKD
jgi:hypothetical protein